jgi:ribosomal protein S18 acetylase RimI-like enzyme
MQVRDVRSDEIEPVRQFLIAHGWAHRVGNAERFAALVAASQRTAVALAEEDDPWVDGTIGRSPAGIRAGLGAARRGHIVGFARGITDGLANGYLSMVVVAPGHRGRGIGSALVRYVMGDDPGITWVLRAGRDGAVEFFSGLGFRVSSVAMERERGPVG